MRIEEKEKPNFKIESVAEFLKRGGKIKHVDFSKTHRKIGNFGYTSIKKNGVKK